MSLKDTSNEQEHCCNVHTSSYHATGDARYLLIHYMKFDLTKTKQEPNPADAAPQQRFHYLIAFIVNTGSDKHVHINIFNYTDRHILIDVMHNTHPLFRLSLMKDSFGKSQDIIDRILTLNNTTDIKVTVIDVDHPLYDVGDYIDD